MATGYFTSRFARRSFCKCARARAVPPAQTPLDNSSVAAVRAAFAPGLAARETDMIVIRARVCTHTAVYTHTVRDACVCTHTHMTRKAKARSFTGIGQPRGAARTIIMSNHIMLMGVGE